MKSKNNLDFRLRELDALVTIKWDNKYDGWVISIEKGDLYYHRAFNSLLDLASLERINYLLEDVEFVFNKMKEK